MAGIPNVNRSISGVRSALYLNASTPFQNRSPRSIGLKSGSGASPSFGGIIQWPWANASEFDRKYMETVVTPASIPVNNVNFTMGEESYLSTDDGVPGTSRVRRKGSGSYSFSTSFPLMISDGSWSTVYPNVLGEFLKNDLLYQPPLIGSQPRMSCMKMATSQQIAIQSGNGGGETSILNMYPVVLKSFNVEASGVGSQGSAPPISCRMETRGILYGQMDDMQEQIRSSFPKDQNLGMSAESGYTRDSRYLDELSNNYPTQVGGRLANIKDCVVMLDGLRKEQVVRMKLDIIQDLDLPSDSVVSSPAQLHLIRYAQSMYLQKRIVSGSFSFLSSNSAGGVRGISGFPINSTKVVGAGLRTGQWSSSLYMRFGPLIFNMKAIYWQPVVQEMSPGSSLVTINFIARSDITGGSEFS